MGAKYVDIYLASDLSIREVEAELKLGSWSPAARPRGKSFGL